VGNRQKPAVRVPGRRAVTARRSRSAKRIGRQARRMVRRVVRALRRTLARFETEVCGAYIRHRRAEMLQRLDRQLPCLKEALDERAVARLFEQQWPHLNGGSDAGLAIRRCRLARAAYEPALRCRSIYDLTVQKPGLPACQTIGVVECVGKGMSLRLFNDDPDLPWLAFAVDANIMRDRFASVLDSADGGTPERCAVVPVLYHPGKRCVMRYDVHTPQGMQTFLGKILRTGSDRLAGVIGELYDLSLGTIGMPSIPPILAHWPDLHMVVMYQVRGLPAEQYLFDMSASEAGRLRWMRDLGRQLATFHHCVHLQVPRRVLHERLRLIRGRAALIAALDRDLATDYAQLVARIENVADSVLGRALVVSHGSFNLRHVLLRGRRAYWMALDGVCSANPAWDVGSLLACMDRSRLRRPDPAPWIERGKDAFLSGYRERGEDLDRQAVALCHATFLLDYAQRSVHTLRVLTKPHMPRQLIDAAAQVLDSLR